MILSQASLGYPPTNLPSHYVKNLIPIVIEVCDASYGHNCRRPFIFLRAKTFLPSFVPCLARNPCLRFLRSKEGWKVRFTQRIADSRLSFIIGGSVDGILFKALWTGPRATGNLHSLME